MISFSLFQVTNDDRVRLFVMAFANGTSLVTPSMEGR